MKIGYARVSTLDQNLDFQRAALAASGCEKVIVDKISGSVAARPGLEKVKEQLRAATCSSSGGSTVSVDHSKI